MSGLGEEERYPQGLTERCELLELLSENSRGETLLVRERDSGRLLVAKCRQKAGVDFDAGEAEILRRLGGSGVPALAGAYESETMYCLLREYIPGETLDKAARGRMTEAQARQIGLSLCRVLRRLHSQDPPIIHRDIKPQNVVLGEDGRVWLIDFDISRRYSRGASADTVISGTQDFAAPEQYGFSQTDCRSDIFSLGVLLYWLVTGRTKVGEASAGSLGRCIRRCTAFDPERRYRSVAAVERGLRASGRRLGGLAVAILAAVILFCGAGAWLLAGGTEAIAFQEPLIEAAVRLALDKGPEDPITVEELALVEGIYIVRGDVYGDLSQYWTYGAVHDSQALAAAGGGVVSLEDLRMLPNLRELGISGGSVSDLCPLAELEKLEQVDLRFNQVASVEALEGLPVLWLVGLSGNPVEDLSPLAGCSALGTLDLCAVPGLTGEMLAVLPGPYDQLDITGAADCGGALAGREIHRLVASVNGDPGLAFLEGIIGLESLELRGTETVDLTALAEHPGLRELRLSAGVTAELTPLLALSALETVILPPELADEAAALGDTPFAVQFE